MATTIDLQVSASHDDAMTAAGGGAFFNEDAQSHIGRDATSWHRFVMGATPIPSGATITAAYLTFTSAGNNSDPIPTVTINGLDVDDVGDFPDEVTAAGYALTTADAEWTVPNWTTDTEYATPSIVDLVQEIVDLMGGIATGEHIGFRTICPGDSNVRYAHSWDEGSHAKGAQLHIEYYLPGSGGMAVGTMLIF